MILDNFILQLLGRRRSIELRRAGYNIELSAPLDNIPFSTSSERERIEENVCLFYCMLRLYVYIIIVLYTLIHINLVISSMTR